MSSVVDIGTGVSLRVRLLVGDRRAKREKSYDRKFYNLACRFATFRANFEITSATVPRRATSRRFAISARQDGVPSSERVNAHS